MPKPCAYRQYDNFAMTTELLNSPATQTAQLWLCDVSADTAATSVCLSAAEQRLADRLTSENRRRAFETARYTGKAAVARMHGCPVDAVEIRSKDETGVTSLPIIYINGVQVDITISISHLDDVVAVAVANGEVRVGIDLAQIQTMQDSFIDMWLSPSESQQLHESADPALTATMNWSTREATFKAMNVEDEFRPRRWSVEFDKQGISCFYQGIAQPVALSFYRITPELLLTVAGDSVDVTFHSELSKDDPSRVSNRGVSK